MIDKKSEQELIAYSFVSYTRILADRADAFSDVFSKELSVFHVQTKRKLVVVKDVRKRTRCSDPHQGRRDLQMD